MTLVLTYRSDELHRRHALRPLLSELERLDRARRIELEDPALHPVLLAEALRPLARRVVPDDEAGELPKAFVVPAGDDLDTDALTSFVAAQVAPHKRIRAIELVEEIPKSPSGKILRRLLRDRAAA